MSNGVLLDIRCPCCTRKLMCVKGEKTALPSVNIADSNNQLDYDVVTRCPSCKSYVGFNTIKYNTSTDLYEQTSRQR